MPDRKRQARSFCFVSSESDSEAAAGTRLLFLGLFSEGLGGGKRGFCEFFALCRSCGGKWRGFSRVFVPSKVPWSGKVVDLSRLFRVFGGGVGHVRWKITGKI